MLHLYSAHRAILVPDVVVSVQQTQISVLVYVAAAVQVETGVFHMRGVMASQRDELQTVRLFGGEAQLVGCLIKRLSVGVGRRHLVTMRKALLIVLWIRKV